MHDIRAIRDDPAGFDAAMARRGLVPAADAIRQKDASRRAALTALQEMQAERNAFSKTVAQLKRDNLPIGDAVLQAAQNAAAMGELEQQVAALDVEIRDMLASLPNVLDADVPDGADEAANVVLKRWGEPHDLGFEPKQHFELGEVLGMMDFAAAGKIAGSRFTVLRGALARMERALGQFMLDLHTNSHGYEEHAVPVLVNDAAMFGTNQMP
jgi:seryl-tRNA synthetase